MELSNRLIDDCVVIDIQEEHLGYPKTMVLKNHASKLIQAGQYRLVLNLSHVQMLDSFGIASIISVLKMCREHNGNMALYGLNEQVNKLMEITHMDRVLEIWESEGQALHQVK